MIATLPSIIVSPSKTPSNAIRTGKKNGSVAFNFNGLDEGGEVHSCKELEKKGVKTVVGIVADKRLRALEATFRTTRNWEKKKDKRDPNSHYRGEPEEGYGGYGEYDKDDYDDDEGENDHSYSDINIVTLETDSKKGRTRSEERGKDEFYVYVCVYVYTYVCMYVCGYMYLHIYANCGIIILCIK
jgi:hypothetical protein